VPPLDLPPQLRARIENVTNRRARFVLDHIVAHGFITADDIQRQGYREHRRAVMDCRDLGFAIARVKAPGGAGAWTLDLDADERARREGRTNFTKTFREALVARAGGRCEACGASQAARALQIDHRVPYEIDPGSGEEVAGEFQMLCGSCNRSKSWTCETDCPNWRLRDPATCLRCMWGNPGDYEHIATVTRRQVTLTFDGPEAVADYERLASAAAECGLALEEYLRDRLA
jgi:hypothetical protein